MSRFSLHIGYKTTRLRDIETMTCDYDYDRFDECLSGHGLYQKTEIPVTPFGAAGIMFL